MIAITGATGNLGKAVLSSLLKKSQASEIVAIVRDPGKLTEFANAGIQVRKADYNDPASLNAPFEGVELLLQVSSAGYGPQAVVEENNVVEAAMRQGVQHIVYTSTLNPSEHPIFWGGQTCVRTEKAIKASGMQYTIFRNSMYLETIRLFIGKAMEDGQIYFPAGKGAISFVSRLDIAEAISIVLAKKTMENRIFEITGPAAFTFSDIAQSLEKVKKIPCAYFDIPAEAFAGELSEAGMHEQEIEFYISMGDSIKVGEFEMVDPTLELILGRKRLTVDQYLTQLFSSTEVSVA